MTVARAEVLSSDETKEWYEDQRLEWSKYLKVFLSQLQELDPSDEGESMGTAG